MNQEIAAAWNQQASYTRVATSVAFAVALMVAFYFLVTTGPTLIDAHALLYRIFETPEQARSAIANFVIYFSLVMQVVLAIACAAVSRKLTGTERIHHTKLNVLMLVHPAVLFIASMLMALAIFTPNAFVERDASNWPIFGMLVLAAIVFAITYFVVIFNMSDYSRRNPMYVLAGGKLMSLLGFATIVPSMLTLTLLVGSFALDLMLRPVGEKIQETSID